MPFWPAPPAAWNDVQTIVCSPNASCSALAGSMTAIVVQFGLATMPLPMWSSASGLTSETTSGTSGSMRHADELSTTSAPAAAKRGDHSREVPPPALKSATSKPWMVSSFSGWTTRSPMRLPAERSDAKGTISSAGNARLSRSDSMIVPTAPVAPTTATRITRTPRTAAPGGSCPRRRARTRCAAP
jgi:hypothetical protein